MKKFTFILLSLFLLTSCGENKDAIPDGLKVHDGETFSVYAPDTWLDLTWDKSLLPPLTGANIELAYSSPDIKKGYSNTMVILSHKLATETNSMDYSIANHVATTKDYLNYTKLDSKKITFDDGDESELYTFEAKYDAEKPTYKFMQIWKVCKKSDAFFLTIGLNIDIKGTAKYENILKSFKCK